MQGQITANAAADQAAVAGAVTTAKNYTDGQLAIESAARSAGDADTLACITGGIAGAFYRGVPDSIATRALALLDHDLRETVTRFCKTYAVAIL